MRSTRNFKSCSKSYSKYNRRTTVKESLILKASNCIPTLKDYELSSRLSSFRKYKCELLTKICFKSSLRKY